MNTDSVSRKLSLIDFLPTYMPESLTPEQRVTVTRSMIHAMDHEIEKLVNAVRLAPPRLKICLPRELRKFYAGRPITYLGAKVLLNESLRSGSCGAGSRSANVNRKQLRHGGRKLMV